jgi:tRNA A37 methylthiotransferase MiaB
MGAVCKALQHPSVFSFLHVPVQSGADPVSAEKRAVAVSSVAAEVLVEGSESPHTSTLPKMIGSTNR